MLTVIPGIVQHPARPRCIRDDERVPVRQVDLPGSVSVNARALHAGVLLFGERQDERVLECNRDGCFRRERRGQGEFEFLSTQVVSSDGRTIHAQGGQVEASRPHVGDDRQHEVRKCFAAVVGVEDGLVHADGFGSIVQRGVDCVLRPL